MVVKRGGRFASQLRCITDGADGQSGAALTGVSSTAKAAAATIRIGRIALGRRSFNSAVIVMAGVGCGMSMRVWRGFRQHRRRTATVGMQRLSCVRLEGRRQGKHKDQDPLQQSHGGVYSTPCYRNPPERFPPTRAAFR